MVWVEAEDKQLVLNFVNMKMKELKLRCDKEPIQIYRNCVVRYKDFYFPELYQNGNNNSINSFSNLFYYDNDNNSYHNNNNCGSTSSSDSGNSSNSSGGSNKNKFTKM